MWSPQHDAATTTLQQWDGISYQDDEQCLVFTRQTIQSLIHMWFMECYWDVYLQRTDDCSPQDVTVEVCREFLGLCGLAFCLTCSVNSMTSCAQVCAFLNYVWSVQFTGVTGGLQASHEKHFKHWVYIQNEEKCILSHFKMNNVVKCAQN